MGKGLGVLPSPLPFSKERGRGHREELSPSPEEHSPGRKEMDEGKGRDVLLPGTPGRWKLAPTEGGRERETEEEREEGGRGGKRRRRGRRRGRVEMGRERD